MDEQFKENAKKVFGFTDAQFDALSEKQLKIIASSGNRKKYKMIAEVVKSENCGYAPKVGDKYVLTGSGKLLPEECTFPICLWGLATILPLSYVVYDRLSWGLDPNEMLFDHIACTDTGCGCGGIGNVVFKVYCEKVG